MDVTVAPSHPLAGVATRAVQRVTKCGLASLCVSAWVALCKVGPNWLLWQILPKTCPGEGGRRSPYPGEGPGCSGTGKCCLSPSQGLPAMGLAKYPTARPYPQGLHRGSRKGVGLGGFYSSQLMLCSQGQVFEDTQIREGGETNSKEFSC